MGYYIGIDLGGTNIATGLCDGEGNLIDKVSILTEVEKGSDGIIDNMERSVNMLLEKTGTSMDRIESIGIGSPGTVVVKEGMVVFASNLPFRKTPVAKILSERTGKPVYLNNDANCAALGEVMGGAAKGKDTALLIVLGTGIGAGIIIDKKIYLGFNDGAGEVGHATIDYHGVDCPCGRKGCWERYAAIPALMKQVQEAMDENPDSLLHKVVAQEGEINGKTAFIAARQGDEVALRVVDKYEEYVAVGLLDQINIFMPEIMVLGGGISKEGEYFIGAVRKKIYDIISATKISLTEIVQAKLGNDAGIVGAAMLGLQG